MFKTILASFGIGAAKVDLVLDKSDIFMGKTVTGTVHVTGGDVPQLIEHIDVDFVLQYFTESSSFEKVIHTIRVEEHSYTLLAGEKREYPIAFVCPTRIPTGFKNTKTNYFFKTNLGIKNAIDSKDHDSINVLPSGIYQNFLLAFYDLGFRIKKEGYNGHIQEFQFQPTSWLVGKFDELKFNVNISRMEQSIDGNFEIDIANQHTGFLADILDLDELKGSFHFTPAELDTMKKAKETIQNFILVNTNKILDQ